ncbi:hypothetical protein HanPSC8_Chr04g0171221 [Helianthus annuus]|nr:hypothetical protein HanPSC8_Chr04g0171221 [Helianthus annuus]
MWWRLKRRGEKRFEDMGISLLGEEVRQRGKRSADLQENKQAAGPLCLRTSARRRHKCSEELLPKKQTPPQKHNGKKVIV